MNIIPSENANKTGKRNRDETLETEAVENIANRLTAKANLRKNVKCDTYLLAIPKMMSPFNI